MGTSSLRRLRGVAFVVSGIVAAALLVYLLVDPQALGSLHPVALFVLLVILIGIAGWQAYDHLR